LKLGWDSGLTEPYTQTKHTELLFIGHSCDVWHEHVDLIWASEK